VNRKINLKSFYKWEYTKKSYYKWLGNNELKALFAKSFKFENFSIWWATKLVNKDVVVDDRWYFNLHNILNNRGYKKKEKSLIVDYLKFILFFFKIIFLHIFIKIFYRTSNDNQILNNNNCFHSFDTNIVKYNKYYVDRQYGFATTKVKKDISYLIELGYNFSLIYQLFSKKKKFRKLPVKYFILNNYVKLSDIIKVYITTTKQLFRLLFFLNKKNYFIINNKNCKSALQNELIRTFLGKIQIELIMGLAFKNFFKEKKFSNFINYWEFYTHARTRYYFFENYKEMPRVVSINHSVFHDNYLNMSIRKNEFINSNDMINFSPKPDVILTQGKKYSDYLKKIFPYKKIDVIGNLKIELENTKINKTRKENIVAENKLKDKKIISLLTSLKDYNLFVKFLNKCDLKNYVIILRPHPAVRNSTLKYFRKNFNFKFKTLDNYNTREIISISDFSLIHSSSMGYESIIKKIKVIRLLDQDIPPLFDITDNVITVDNAKALNQMFIKKNLYKSDSATKIIKDFYYKYDKKSHIRLHNFLNKLKN
jgi:hypothetical protein